VKSLCRSGVTEDCRKRSREVQIASKWSREDQTWTRGSLNDLMLLLSVWKQDENDDEVGT